MLPPVIEARRLTKRFGNTVAVNNLDITLERGKTLALLGGNGAGKTTTISMLLGLLLPSDGQVLLFGKPLETDRAGLLARANFSSPYVDLPHRLSVRQNLNVYARLYGVPRPKDRIAELAEELDLHSFLDRAVGALSAGQKTRVGLAKALVNNPELLLLDEPTASLDPDTADWVRSYLERYQARSGAAILLASHNMGEVERLAHDVVMMKAGRAVDQGSPQALLAKYGRSTMEDVFLDIARGRGQGAAA